MMDHARPERTLVARIVTARSTLVVAAIGAAIVGTGAALAIQARQPSVLDCGEFQLIAEPPLRTGHQRAERLCFADSGRLLAVTCPRYGRVVLYRIGETGETPTQVADIATGGRPVAVQASADRLYALMRPSGDARHLESAWLQAYDFDGQPIGSRFRVGFDPDDMVLMPDERTMLVLLSGHAEGETNRPDPSLAVVDLSDSAHPRIRGEVAFDQPGDDPERIALDPANGRGVRYELPWFDNDSIPWNRPWFEDQLTSCGRRPFDKAAVSLRGSNQIAWIDLEVLDRPRIIARNSLPGGGEPGPLTYGNGRTLMATDLTSGSVWMLSYGVQSPDNEPVPAVVADTHAGTVPHPPGSPASMQPRRLPFSAGIGEVTQMFEPTSRNLGARSYTLGTLPGDSGLEVLDPEGRLLGRLPLNGPLGFGGVIPMSMAGTGERGPLKVAIADRSGGVHLVRIRGRGEMTLPQ